MKPCTLGKRHRWQFVKNVIQVTNGVQTARVSQRGIYRCECGSRKYGVVSVPAELVQQLVECDHCPTSGGCVGVCMKAQQPIEGNDDE